MKKLFKENKIVFTLLIIAIVAIIVTLLLLFRYFYFGNGKTVYGDRLKGIENVEITSDKRSEVESKINEDSLVDNSNVMVKGKIIYIKIIFNKKATLEEAKSVAVKSLEYFKDEEKAFYDFNFTLQQNVDADVEGFLIMGAKNVSGSNLIWNNNNKQIETNKDDK